MIRKLRKVEVDRFLNFLRKRYGFKRRLDYIFFLSGKKRLRIVSLKVRELRLGSIGLKSVGLYIARKLDKGFRLSVEGTQLIGPWCTKNVVELSEQELERWMSGKGLEVRCRAEDGFVILKHKQYYVGSGKYRSGRIQSFLPKSRRVLR